MSKHYSLHHRRPRSIGGTDDPDNLSVVKTSEHRAWHHLFSNLEADAIADLINNCWIDPDVELVVIRRVLSNRRKAA